MLTRRHINYGTQTMEGRASWDTFMSLAATARQLRLRFFEYLRDRISQTMNVSAVATIIWWC